MLIRTIDGKKEIIIEPSENELIKSADEELNSLSKENKELVENIFSYNLVKKGRTEWDQALSKQIASSLKIILSGNSTVFILNTIPNIHNINFILEEFMSRGLIRTNTSVYLKNLSVKYGAHLESLISITKNPLLWNQISSDGKISDDLFLSSRLWRMDGNYFDFDSRLKDGILLANHFTHRIIEIIEKTDREAILDLSLDSLDELQEGITKLKELYESVEAEVKAYEEETFESSE